MAEKPTPLSGEVWGSRHRLEEKRTVEVLEVRPLDGDDDPYVFTVGITDAEGKPSLTNAGDPRYSRIRLRYWHQNYRRIS